MSKRASFDALGFVADLLHRLRKRPALLASCLAASLLFLVCGSCALIALVTDGGRTPTPEVAVTPDVVATVAPTETATPTATPTPAASATPTAPATPTATPTPAASATPTIPATPTLTPTPMATATPAARATPTPVPAPVQPTATPVPAQPGCIDINTAPREELIRIIHIGEVRVDELIRLRPYSSVDQLTRIDGIGPGRLRDIKQQGLACVP